VFSKEDSDEETEEVCCVLLTDRDTVQGTRHTQVGSVTSEGKVSLSLFSEPEL